MDGNCVPYLAIHTPVIFTLLTPYYLTVACIIPAGVMVYSYVAIGLTLRKSSKFQRQVNTKGSNKLQRAETNIFQTCAILMLMFVVVWTVYAIAFLLIQIELFNDPNKYFLNYTGLLIFLNCCLNPYVYCFRYEEFQLHILYMFRRN